MSLAKGLSVQARVVHALVLRETRTRFGAYHLGYLWAFIEPALFILLFYGIFYLANREAPYGMDIVSFLTTGIIPYILFRETAGRSMAAIAGNKALLYYPQVRPLDLVISRSSLEVATLIMVFTVIMGFNDLFRQTFVIDSLSGTLAGLLLAGLLGASLGLVLCSLSVFSNTVERIAPPLLRPIFWISGLFFTANDLPSNIREMFLWNPVLHATELVRDGYFPSYRAHYANIDYLLGWILGLAFLGLELERVARQRIEMT